MEKVKLSADSTCDLSKELIDRYKVDIQPLHVNLGENDFRDGVDITPDDIYKTYEEQGILPKTSAPNPAEYIEHFQKWTDEGFEVIHLSLGSSLSSSYQNARIAAEELENVYIIDSGNLSTGMGLLVIEAGERIAKGMETAKIGEEVEDLKKNVNASFVIDDLTYLYAGGRLTPLEAYGAKFLKIKPSIEIDNSVGKMDVGKKYRGKYEKVLKRYVNDRLNNKNSINKDRIFITHSGTAPENIEMVKAAVEENYDFKEIFVTRAGCTISSHCGPNTLGVLFMNK